MKDLPSSIVEHKQRGTEHGDVPHIYVDWDPSADRELDDCVVETLKVTNQRKDHRTIVSALLWLLRTGLPWRDLPERYGPWKTATSSKTGRQQAAIWQRILAWLQHEADADGTLDWSLHYVNGTIIRAHQHASGARRLKDPEHPDEVLRRSQGGFSAKIHLRSEGGGKAIAFLITAGQRHEQTMFETLMETEAVKRAGRGWPRIRPDRVAGDKGYSSRKIQRYLRRRGTKAVIPRQKRERRTRFDKGAYRQRHPVERLVDRLKGFRRIATRYEKRATHYLGKVTLAAICLWLARLMLHPRSHHGEGGWVGSGLD